MHVPGEGWVGNVEVRGLGEAAIGADEHRPARRWRSRSRPRAARVLASVRQPDDGLRARPGRRRRVPADRGRAAPAAGRGWIAWYVVPRLRCRGRATVGGPTRSTSTGASAYHDHNWGRWHWGDDLGWEWGCFLAPAPGPAFFLSRTTDRAHRSGHAVPDRRLSGRRGSALRRAGPSSVTTRGRARDARCGVCPGALAALHSDRAAPRLGRTLLAARRTTGSTGSRSGSPRVRRPRSSPGTPSSPATASSTSSSGEFEFAVPHRRARGRGRRAGGGRACRLSRPSPGAGRTLGEYVSALIAALGRADPAALARMQQRWSAAAARGSGSTTRRWRSASSRGRSWWSRPSGVRGRREGSDRPRHRARPDGRLSGGQPTRSRRAARRRRRRRRGGRACSPRSRSCSTPRRASPELQALAREFRERPGRRPPCGPVRGRGGATPRPAETVAAQEHALLARLDLLPDGAGAPPRRR